MLVLGEVRFFDEVVVVVSSGTRAGGLEDCSLFMAKQNFFFFVFWICSGVGAKYFPNLSLTYLGKWIQSILRLSRGIFSFA